MNELKVIILILDIIIVVFLAILISKEFRKGKATSLINKEAEEKRDLRIRSENCIHTDTGTVTGSLSDCDFPKTSIRSHYFKNETLKKMGSMDIDWSEVIDNLVTSFFVRNFITLKLNPIIFDEGYWSQDCSYTCHNFKYETLKRMNSVDLDWSPIINSLVNEYIEKKLSQKEEK